MVYPEIVVHFEVSNCKSVSDRSVIKLAHSPFSQQTYVLEPLDKNRWLNFKCFVLN